MPLIGESGHLFTRSHSGTLAHRSISWPLAWVIGTVLVIFIGRPLLDIPPLLRHMYGYGSFQGFECVPVGACWWVPVGPPYLNRGLRFGLFRQSFYQGPACSAFGRGL